MTLKQQRIKVAEAIGIVLRAPIASITRHANDFYWVRVQLAMPGDVLNIQVFDNGSMAIMPGGNLVSAAAVALQMNPVTERDKPDLSHADSLRRDVDAIIEYFGPDYRGSRNVDGPMLNGLQIAIEEFIRLTAEGKT